MEKRDMPLWGGLIYVTVCEHSVGRLLLRNARIALEGFRSDNPWAIDDLNQYMNSCIELLIQHITKENEVLFQMAHQLISEGEDIEEVRRLREDSTMKPF